MTKNITSVILYSIWTLVALATVAEGSDKKIYPGANCQPATGEGTAYYSKTGRIYNVSTTEPLTLVCPVVRDNTTASWQAISVVVRNPAQANIVCTAETRTASGGLSKADQRFLPAGGTSWITVSFEALPAPNQGFYQIVCGFPAAHSGSSAAGIASYSVTEP